jgi:hypothetical protein
MVIVGSIKVNEWPAAERQAICQRYINLVTMEAKNGLGIFFLLPQYLDDIRGTCKTRGIASASVCSGVKEAIL